MSKVRGVALVGVMCVLGAGVTRAARTSGDDALRAAKGRLALAAAAAGLQDNPQDDLLPPDEQYEVELEEEWEFDEMEVDEEKPIDVKGKFPKGSKVQMRDAPAPRKSARSLPERLFAVLFPRSAVPAGATQETRGSLSAPRAYASAARASYAVAAGGQSAVERPGRCFAQVTRSITPTQATLWVKVLPTALPGTKRVELVTPKGRVVSAHAGYVVGRWQFDLRSDNGWRVRVTPQPVDVRSKELTYALDFFRGTEATPFQRRGGRLSLSEDRCGTENPTLNISLAPAQADDQCSAVQARAGEIAARMAAGGAAQEKVLAEFEAIQEAVQACMTKQMIEQDALLQKLADPAGQAQMQAEQDNFGCGSLSLVPGVPGTVTGTLYCGKNVQYPRVTGTMTYVR